MNQIKVATTYLPSRLLRATTLGRRGGLKPLEHWRELELRYVQGPSIIVYQHFPREERGQYLRRQSVLMEEHLGATPLILRASRVAFIVAPQQADRDLLAARARDASALWSPVFTLHE